MLFMSIFTWDPEKRDAVFKRRLEAKPPAGKVIGEWLDIGGGRVFMVSEGDDPKAGLAASLAWNDLGDLEIIPIMSAQDGLKAAASMKAGASKKAVPRKR